MDFQSCEISVGIYATMWGIGYSLLMLLCTMITPHNIHNMFISSNIFKLNSNTKIYSKHTSGFCFSFHSLSLISSLVLCEFVFFNQNIEIFSNQSMCLWNMKLWLCIHIIQISICIVNTQSLLNGWDFYYFILNFFSSNVFFFFFSPDFENVFPFRLCF